MITATHEVGLVVIISRLAMPPALAASVPRLELHYTMRALHGRGQHLADDSCADDYGLIHDMFSAVISCESVRSTAVGPAVGHEEKLQGTSFAGRW